MFFQIQIDILLSSYIMYIYIYILCMYIIYMYYIMLYIYIYYIYVLHYVIYIYTYIYISEFSLLGDRGNPPTSQKFANSPCTWNNFSPTKG